MSSDEIGHEFEKTIRAAVTALSQMIEMTARYRARVARLHATREQADAVELQRRAKDIHDTARGVYGPVTQPGWWHDATPERVGEAIAIAQRWAPHDQTAQAALDALDQGARQRWGYGVDDVVAEAERRVTDPQQVQQTEQVETAQQRRHQAELDQTAEQQAALGERGIAEEDTSQLEDLRSGSEHAAGTETETAEVPGMSLLMRYDIERTIALINGVAEAGDGPAAASALEHDRDQAEDLAAGHDQAAELAGGRIDQAASDTEAAADVAAEGTVVDESKFSAEVTPEAADARVRSAQAYTTTLRGMLHKTGQPSGRGGRRGGRKGVEASVARGGDHDSERGR